MTAAYDALLASAAPEFVVLVEVQPMERLGAWTAAGGGLTNTYYASFPTQIATSIVSGGIYRRLDSVRQNATALTSRASAALVDANLGSYFLDTSTSRLYVSTTTGAHPDTFALLGAWFTLFFSTRSVTFSDQPLYEPRVSETPVTVIEEMPDPLFGSIVSSEGSVSFLNGDTLFDRLSKQYVWRNKTVSFKLGGVGLAYADFAAVTTLRVNQIVPNDDVCVLQLETMGTVLNQELPIRSWGEFEPVRPPTDQAQGLSGQSQPLILGQVIAAPITFAGGSETWYIYDNSLPSPYNECQVTGVFAVDRVSKDGVQLGGFDFALNSDDSTVSILNGTYFHDTHDIVVTITQLGTASEPLFGTMALALLIICGESTANINTSAFSDVNFEVPLPLARFIGGTPRPAIDWMTELCQSVGAQVYIGSDGRWTCRLIRPDIPTSVVEFSDAEGDFVSWDPTEDLTKSLSEIRVRYANRPYVDDWAEASSSDDTVRYGNETSDSHRIDTWMIREGDATAQAGHLRFFSSIPPVMIRSEERGLKAMQSHAGDGILITRQRAPVARTGSYDGHLLRIVKIEKSLGPDVPRVVVTVNDLDGQADRIFRLAPSGSTLTWSTATARERAQYGFLADANRYIDATDPLTRDAKALW